MSIDQFLTALSWPRSEPEVVVAPPTFIGRLLNSLTYSVTAVALREDERHKNAKNAANDTLKSMQIEELWDKAHHNMIKKHPERAVPLLNQILELDNNNAAAMNRLGIIYAQKGKTKKAIEYFQATVKLDRKSAAAHHNLGLAYYDIEDYDNASTELHYALKLEGTSAARHIAYGIVQEKLGNDEALLTALEQAVELEKNVQTLFVLLEAYDHLGMTAEAAAVERELLDMIVPFQKLRRSLASKPRLRTLYVGVD